MVEGNDAFAISAVPQTVMELLAIGCFVIDEEHVFLFAGEVDNHAVPPGLLLDVPKDLRLGLVAIELRATEGPEFREIEFVAFPFVIDGAEELPLQGDGTDFRAAATDIKNGVFKPFSALTAHEMIGGEPNPRRGEVLAPVLVRISITVFGADEITLAIKENLALKGAFHSLGVPEHFKELQGAEEFSCAIANVEGYELFDFEVPADLPAIAHIFRMGFRFSFTDADAPPRGGLIEITIRGFDGEWCLRVKAHLIPPEEAVELPRSASPAADIDHQIGGACAVFLAFFFLAEDRLISA